MTKYTTAAVSDAGIVKEVNQDCVLIEEAMTPGGTVLLVAVCDGMGGLRGGEDASAIMTGVLSQWFEETLPSILYDKNFLLDQDAFKAELSVAVRIADNKIKRTVMGESGTTVTAALFLNNKYYIANVGDSRAYILRNNFTQLTTDQTLVQQLIDQGLISHEEAERHPQKNVLLQCVGASDTISPEFLFGDVEKGDIFVVCSDGFRHVITVNEFEAALRTGDEVTEGNLQKKLVKLVNTVKTRGERDNISAVVIHVSCGEEA